MVSIDYRNKILILFEHLFAEKEVEGKGGRVNLIKCKRKYLESCLPKGIEFIEHKTKECPDFRNELYEKLWSFFSSYVNEVGNICYSSTAYPKTAYIKIPTDKDMYLFTKVDGLYYIKTDVLIQSVSINLGNVSLYFDASEFEHKKANERKNFFYELSKVDDNKIVIKVSYVTGNHKFDIEELHKRIKEQGYDLSIDDLSKSIQTFEKQSKVDYFLNPKAKSFLKEQFSLYLLDYILKSDEITVDRANKINILRDVAFYIIDFITQFEEEVVKIWEKPKFVLKSNYVLTLSEILDKGGFEIIKKIETHVNYDKQVQEWFDLGLINNKPDSLLKQDLFDGNLEEQYRNLPIDTKYFKDLEGDILSLFDDLEEEIDGYLIKSDNWQALNMLKNRYRGRVKLIYIDPPFNLGYNEAYEYLTDYLDSSWSVMLHNRIKLAYDILSEQGLMFVRCDANGEHIVRFIMNDIFGKENFRNNININRANNVLLQKSHNVALCLPPVHEFIIMYGKSEKALIKKLTIPIIDRKTGEMIDKIPGQWRRLEIGEKASGRHISLEYDFYGLKPGKGKCWLWSKDRAYKAYDNYQEYLKVAEQTGEDIEMYAQRTGITDFARIIEKNGKRIAEYYAHSRYTDLLSDDWYDIPSYGGNVGFKTANAPKLLERVISLASDEGDIVMDFFLGSGTTTAVAHELKRKWIGVEMGEHFYTVVIPRMKKVLYKCGGFFKYFELEQYDDVLSKVVYRDSEFIDLAQAGILTYAFMFDDKLLSYANCSTNGNYYVTDRLSNLYDSIDIAESLSLHTGKTIKKIVSDRVVFSDGQTIDMRRVPLSELKNFLFW